MTDVFSLMAEKAGHTDETQYGMSGEMKKTQYKLELIGDPFDPDTLKCILTAAEQGMEMSCYSTFKDDVENMHERIAEISPFLIVPCLKEADFVTCGVDAITAFIDARGLGYALTPRNAALAAMQNYWVDVAVTNVAPNVLRIVEERITKKANNTSHEPSEEIIEESCKALQIYFDALDQQLSNKKYVVCDKYTWADLHWTAYAHLCSVAECEDLINERQFVKKWFDRIKVKKSQCGQNVVAYDLLPNKEDILKGILKSVEIEDF